MKKFTFSLLLLVPFLLLLYFISPTKAAAQTQCVQTGDTCDTLTSNAKPCCNPTDQCVETGHLNHISLKICQPAPVINTNCICDNPDKAGSGINGFRCTLAGVGEIHGFCDSAEQACIQGGTSDIYEDAHWDDSSRIDTAQGIICQRPPDKLVEPAAPPCAPDGLKDGICTSVVTAFGEIGVKPEIFISRLFGILLAPAGTIAVILFLRAGYQIMTARGNPEGIKEGREKIVAVIVGLMFLIFSFVLLQVLGVDLLRLPQ